MKMTPKQRELDTVQYLFQCVAISARYYNEIISSEEGFHPDKIHAAEADYEDWGQVACEYFTGKICNTTVDLFISGEMGSLDNIEIEDEDFWRPYLSIENKEYLPEAVREYYNV